MGLSSSHGRQKNSPPYSGGLRVWFKESLFTLESSNRYAKVRMSHNYLILPHKLLPHTSRV